MPSPLIHRTRAPIPYYTMFSDAIRKTWNPDTIYFRQIGRRFEFDRSLESFSMFTTTPYDKWKTLAYETHLNFRDLLAIRSRYFQLRIAFQAIFERLRSQYAYYVKKRRKAHLYTNRQTGFETKIVNYRAFNQRFGYKYTQQCSRCSFHVQTTLK